MNKNPYCLSIAILLLCLTSGFLPAQNLMKIDLGGKWKFRQGGTTEWMDAKVPGCVHTDLMRDGKIPEPFYRDNENAMQWISDAGWEYEKTFTVSDTLFRHRHMELVCEGLDTYANVYLNDSLLFVADNMFREWYADIFYGLRIGVNKLRIQFPSIPWENRSRYSKLKLKLPGEDKVVCRKAAYQFGWDWGPTFITSGIWRPIYIRVWDHMNVLGVQYVQKNLTDSLATLQAVFTVLSTLPDTATIELSVGDKILARKRVGIGDGPNVARVDFQIRDPKRWWPNGYGDPYLYPIHHKIIFNGKVAGQGTTKLGLRTVEFYEDDDNAGTNFYFKVNDVPIFMKGANYVPQDNFLTRVTDSSYRALIRSVKDAHMNMLRVWGGGIYENNIFYDLCDENGILVWQDFMFANAMYPDNKEFIVNVQTEAIQNVVRLRNHPCLALWCGNNEIDEGWRNWGWQKQFGYTPEDSLKIWNNYAGIFGHTLLMATSRFDSLRAYIMTSPLYGWGNTESIKRGDMHYWGVWWGKEPFSSYDTQIGRFMSEYGFQGFPSIETIWKFTLPADRQLGSPVMKAHQKHLTGYETIDEYLLRDYNKPKDFESYGYVSQVLQAEGIKTAIEAHRRAKPVCMGTLYWQLNDCWPVVSWSSRDYYGREKALHYFLRNEYATFLVSAFVKDAMVQIHIVSDSLNDCEVKLHLKSMDFHGKPGLDTTLTVMVFANTSSAVGSIPIDVLIGKMDMKEVVFTAELKIGGRILSRNNVYFEPVKDLHLEKPSITRTVKPAKDGYSVTLSTDKLAKNVYLNSDLKGAFSDNYFDLLPGETRTISFITTARNASFADKMKIMTIADTY